MSERAVWLGLDPWTAAHLAVAIRLHRERMQRTYTPVPPLLAEIERWVETWSAETVSKDPQGSTFAGGLPSADSPSIEPLLLTLERTAEVLAVSPSTVKRLIAGDPPELPSLLVAGARRIHRDDIDQYLARQRRAAS